MFVLVMICVYTIKMIVIMQFFWILVMLKIMGDTFECDQVSLNHESLNIG